MQQQEDTLSKDPKDSAIKHSWTEQNTRCEPLSCVGSGGSSLGDTLKKALLISWIAITLYYFRIVRTCCSLLILPYFLCLASGT